MPPAGKWCRSTRVKSTSPQSAHASSTSPLASSVVSTYYSTLPRSLTSVQSKRLRTKTGAPLDETK